MCTSRWMITACSLDSAMGNMSKSLTRSEQGLFFFFNDPATTEIYPLSLHDALPISLVWGRREDSRPCRRGHRRRRRRRCRHGRRLHGLQRDAHELVVAHPAGGIDLALDGTADLGRPPEIELPAPPIGANAVAAQIDPERLEDSGLRLHLFERLDAVAVNEIEERPSGRARPLQLELPFLADAQRKIEVPVSGGR